jgi:hypothetical protein
MTTTLPATPEIEEQLASAAAEIEQLVDAEDLVESVGAPSEANEVKLSAEDFRELMRLTDHVASAPFSERYKQELRAFAAARGLTL